MHIEPGVLASTKVLLANGAAVALLAAHTPALFKRPALWLRTAGAAVFFSLFMQAFHLPVGPSELHFVGAMPVYLSFGALPALFGFALGLLAQGLLFEPQDLVHLGVNFLSLAVPLLALHHTLGARLAPSQLRASQLVKLDAVYYAGVTLMVGFWLSQAETSTALADWAQFAVSYLAIVAIEPLVTIACVRGVAMLRERRWARTGFDERLFDAAG